MVVLLILISLLALSPVFATTASDGKPIVYCPEYIECDADRKLNSCHLSDNKYNLWQIRESTGTVAKGVYHLSKVSSTYERPTPGMGSCRYIYTNKDGAEKEIFSSLYPFFNKLYSANAFGAYLGSSSQWTVVGWEASCTANDPKLCPLVEYPGIYYGRSSPNESIYFNIGTKIYTQLSYDTLLNLCGATSVCKVGIASYVESGQSITPLGSIKVDLAIPDRVTVVEVYSDSPDRWKFKKHEIFNIISVN